mgnify:CR=1 FL=1
MTRCFLKFCKPGRAITRLLVIAAIFFALALFIIFLINFQSKVGGIVSEDEIIGLSGLESTKINDDLVAVKYRDDLVDLTDSRFEKFIPEDQSLVRGLWYDMENKYLIIDLNGVYYHYCDLSEDTLLDLKTAGEIAEFYKNEIYETHDCRFGLIPQY